MESKEEILYNILLETHDKMQVNNLDVETLHPDNIIAKYMILTKDMPVNMRNNIINSHNMLYAI